MAKNRSAPVDTVLPHVAYRDLPTAIDWLVKHFGFGYNLQSLTIFFDDVDAHHRKVKSTGIRLVEQLHQTVYGELQYAVQDLEGHLWIFSQHAKDLTPDQWGAKITT
jgi:uncharacterized glyoxalase superfamily protein PhnB